MLTRSRLTVAVVVAGLALLIAGNALAATETHIDQEPAVGGPAPPPGSGVSLSVPQFGHAVDFTVCFLTGISAQVNQGNLMLDFTANALSKVTVVYTYLPASINIEKSTNGEDADSQTGPLVPVGDQVTWVYLVENTGEIALDPVAVTDDVLGPVTTCLKTALAPAETTTCTVMGTAVAGQYGNTGTATGTAVGTDLEVMDTDPSHYFGETVVCPPDRGKHDGMGHKKGGKKFWLLGLLAKLKDKYYVLPKDGSVHIKLPGKLRFGRKGGGKYYGEGWSYSVDKGKYSIREIKVFKKRKHYYVLEGPYEQKGKKVKDPIDKLAPYHEPGTGETSVRITTAPLEQVVCVAPAGYWKRAGKNDEAWALVGPKGKRMTFFKSRLTYANVLKKKSGRPYYRLARAYITVRLNVAAGVRLTPRLEKTVAWSERYFGRRGPGYTKVSSVRSIANGDVRAIRLQKLKRVRKNLNVRAAILHGFAGVKRCTS